MSTPPVTTYRFRAGQELGGSDTRALILGDVDRDLKQGLEAIEERAREELGMVRDDETFYQIIEEQPAPAETQP